MSSLGEMSWTRMPRMTSRIVSVVEPGSGFPAWIVEGGDGRPLGTAFLRAPASATTGELRIHVHPAERRRGPVPGC